jgi:hypothetical protein
MKTYILVHGHAWTKFKADDFDQAALMADALCRVKCWINARLYVETAEFRDHV